MRAAEAGRFSEGRDDVELVIPHGHKVPAKQPELLGREEISRLLVACTHPVRRMLLQTIYASGLRVSEACALRITDVDSAPDHTCIRVASGKGRYTLLSPTLLELLRAYVRNLRPSTLGATLRGTSIYERADGLCDQEC